MAGIFRPIWDISSNASGVNWLQKRWSHFTPPIFTVFAMFLCSNSHPEVKYISPTLETAPALWFTLAQRMNHREGVFLSPSLRRLNVLPQILLEPGLYHLNKAGLPCWRMKDHFILEWITGEPSDPSTSHPRPYQWQMTTRRVSEPQPHLQR